MARAREVRADLQIGQNESFKCGLVVRYSPVLRFLKERYIMKTIQIITFFAVSFYLLNELTTSVLMWFLGG